MTLLLFMEFSSFFFNSDCNLAGMLLIPIAPLIKVYFVVVVNLKNLYHDDNLISACVKVCESQTESKFGDAIKNEL